MPKFFFMNKVTNIVVEQAVNGISRIKLNDPKSYNALSSKTLKLLIDIFKKLNNDRKTKVIILEGLGKGFSAGHDLKEITEARSHKDGGSSYFKDLFNSCSDLMKLMFEK